MSYKVLGQAAPAAATPTDLYIAPIGLSAVVSTLTVCNQITGSVAYRLAVRPGGAPLAIQHYITYDALLPGNATDALTLGITLGPGDVVTVYSASAGLSFSLFGTEL